MKKRIALIAACAVLLFAFCVLMSHIESTRPKSSSYWFGRIGTDNISVHLMPDWDGVWPFSYAMFQWQRYERADVMEYVCLPLDDGENRLGRWSQEGDVVTLKFDDGETVTGTISEAGLLLDCDGGILLEYCYISGEGD